MKKVIITACVVLLAAFLTACQKTDYSLLITPAPTSPDATGPKVPFAGTGRSDRDSAAKPDSASGSKPASSPEPTPDTAKAHEPDSEQSPNSEPTSALTPTPEPTSAPTPSPKPVYRGSYEIPADITDPVDKYEYLRGQIVDNADYYNALDNTSKDTWCFERKKDHSQSGSYEFFKISDYNSLYVDRNVSDDDKVMYLTFDCGYPSDLTPGILDTLKAHHAVGNFFVTKMYIEGCPDYCIRMKKEGHMVCNHTVSHSDLRDKSVEKIAAEIFDCAEYFYETTGYEFDPYFRTPTGAYTKKLLTLISDAGYTTVFWSIAYGDYDADNQPEPGYVLNHFTTYHHNGAIALMHNDSTSNANELDAVLTMLEEEGYRFAPLSELTIN